MTRMLKVKNPECDWCFVMLKPMLSEDGQPYYQCPRCGECDTQFEEDFDLHE